MPTDAEMLKVYLAERDVACPGCGYSLKGCASANCPECGTPIELSLRGQTTSSAPWIFGTVVISAAFGLAVPTLLWGVSHALRFRGFRWHPDPVLCVPLAVGIGAVLWVWITRRAWFLKTPGWMAWTLVGVLGTITWTLALAPFFTPP